MRKRLSLILGLLTLFVGFAAAQNTVSGVVVSGDDGEPIIGATVTEKGTKKATVTDIDGKFSLSTSSASPTLEITYIGMKKVTVKGSRNMKVTMQSDADVLDEVVVTGMQQMDKRLFTGATAKVDAEKARLDGVADVTRALEGRVAGVSVENVSGTFGTAPKIRVRGATSIYGNSSPLWVVDGVIMEDAVNVSADDLSSGDAETLISNAIAGLNADDIESFQVLKDGSATSIYGARAMAGVVVITTKKGRVGHSSINYTGEFTYRLKPTYNEYNISNSQEQMGIYREMEKKGWLEFSALANGSSSGLYGRMYSLMDKYEDGQFGLPFTQAAMNKYLSQAEFRNTDWFDLLFDDNIMHNHSVSISSGTERANLYASLSALQDPGWYKDSKVERYTANVNASYNLSKNVTLTMRTTGSVRDQKAPGTLSQNVDVVSGAVNRNFDINPFSFCMNTSRTLDPYDTYTRNYAPFNIFDELDNNYIDLSVMDIKFQGELSWKPILGLELKALGSYRVNKSTQEHYVLNHSNQAEAYRAGVDNPNVMYSNTYLYQDPDNPNSLPVSVMPQGGIFTLNRNSVKQLDVRFTANYNKVWNDTHIFNILAGMEANKADREASENTTMGVDYELSRIVIKNAQREKQMLEEGTTTDYFSKYWNRRLAYFLNANYSYAGRYVLNLTGRYDGSNQLGKARSSRWLPTWNVSTSWNAHEETFFKKWMEKTRFAVSHATLRLSYSLNAEFPENLAAYAAATPIYQATNIWRPWGDQQETGLSQRLLGNKDLTYEKKHEFNVGFDLGFLSNRINLTADLYWRDNFDLMGYLYTEGAGGEIRKFANVAKMKSNGVEATLSTLNIKSTDFSWNSDLTFSYTNTEITDLLSDTRVIDLVRSGGYTRVGYPHRALFSIPFVGLNDEGIPTIINEEGNVTTSDINFQENEKLDFLKYEGSAEPTVTGGLNNQFRYKNWRLNVFITYSFGNKIRMENVFSYAYSDQDAMPKEFKNRWVIPGDEKITNIPAIASVRQYYNDRYISYAYNAYNYSTARTADGGFIRMKDISLTYDFNNTLVSKIGLGSASLKLDATNLFLIYSDKKLNGQDPEFVNAGGVASPLSKQFTLTVRLGI
ncbi:MAG: SusC/RagA family TonB-linked outer membrane protein [Prevotella sp.]|nr:SusC/RagA family TonB-linked outer membrane protein [Prevotella sp.]